MMQCCALPPNRTGGIQVNILNSKNKLLEDNQIIPFDTVVSNINNVLRFNPSSSTITARVPGAYLVNYYINTNGTSADVNIKLTCNNISSEATYSVQGQMNGFAVLCLDVNDTISVINDSNQQILLGGNSIQGSIVVTKL